MYKLTLLFVLFFISCKQETNHQKYNFEKKWAKLKDSIGGCLTGNEYCFNGSCGGEGCCFNENKEWKHFFEQDKKLLTKFLISKLNKTAKTEVHVCPFEEATEGELVIYALQRIHKINWFELDSTFYKYSNEKYLEKNKIISYQKALKLELNKKENIVLFIKRWSEKTNK